MGESPNATSPDIRATTMEDSSSEHNQNRQWLDQLIQTAAAQDTTALKILLQAAPKESTWMTTLIEQLLHPPMESTESMESAHEQALLVVGTLAQLDPTAYLLPISQTVRAQLVQASVSASVSASASASSTDGGGVTPARRTPARRSRPVRISPALLHVWMQQLTQTTQVAVHTNLLEALLVAVSLQGPQLLEPAMTSLMHIGQARWTELQQDERSRYASEASIVLVRCMTVWLESVVRLGDVAFRAAKLAGAPRLFTDMLQDTSDPLLQLSLLDLLPQLLDSTSPSTTPSTKEPIVVDVDVDVDVVLQARTKQWLLSPELVEPVLHSLTTDPLLASAAMQLLSWIGSLEEQADEFEGAPAQTTTTTTTTTMTSSSTLIRQTLYQYIRTEVGVTTNDIDRLAVVTALSRLVQSNNSQVLQEVLNDAPLRKCWWGDLSRLSSPKLQAAILSSLAQVLVCPTMVRLYPKLGLGLYSLVGQDNTSGRSTTDWMYDKYVRRPLPEVRIASYAIWTAVAALAGSSGSSGSTSTCTGSISGTTVLATSNHFMTWLLDVETHRESTMDARVAKFDLLQTFYQQSKGFLAMDLVRQLERGIALGPHGRKPHQWEIAVE